jgi:hypothetical protein
VRNLIAPALAGLASVLFSGLAAAAETSAAPAATAESVAQELANPLAPVTTLGAQARAEFGWGPDDDSHYTLRLQPSFFKPLRDRSAFLLRTIAPLRTTRFPASEAGLGDITLAPYLVPDITRSVFFGVGGALVLPTASDANLGTERWSAGPALIVAKTRNPVTWGALAQHLWSFAGDRDRDDVNVTTFQPFVTRVLGQGWSASANSELSYNWDARSGERWTVPVAVSGARVIDVGGQFINVGLAYVEYLDGPDLGPEREVRLNATYVIR